MHAFFLVSSFLYSYSIFFLLLILFFFYLLLCLYSSFLFFFTFSSITIVSMFLFFSSRVSVFQFCDHSYFYRFYFSLSPFSMSVSTKVPLSNEHVSINYVSLSQRCPILLSNKFAADVWSSNKLKPPLLTGMLIEALQCTQLSVAAVCLTKSVSRRQKHSNCPRTREWLQYYYPTYRLIRYFTHICKVAAPPLMGNMKTEQEFFFFFFTTLTFASLCIVIRFK
jgi:hypothetical protein